MGEGERNYINDVCVCVCALELVKGHTMQWNTMCATVSVHRVNGGGVGGGNCRC